MSQKPRYRLRMKIEAVGTHVTLNGKAPQDADGFCAISTMIFFFSLQIFEIEETGAGVSCEQLAHGRRD